YGDHRRIQPKAWVSLWKAALLPGVSVWLTVHEGRLFAVLPPRTEAHTLLGGFWLTVIVVLVKFSLITEVGVPSVPVATRKGSCVVPWVVVSVSTKSIQVPATNEPASENEKGACPFSLPSGARFPYVALD